MRDLLFGLIVAAAGISTAHAQKPSSGVNRAAKETPTLNRDTQRRVDAVLNADDVYAAETRYAELFRKLSPTQIAELKKHPNTGIALRAAWEEACLDVPRLLRSSSTNRLNRHSPGEAVVDLNRKSVDQFLKSVQERLKANTPKWWETAIRSGKAGLHGSGSYLGFRLPVLSYFDETFDMGLPIGTRLENHPNGVVLKVGKESAIVSKRMLDEHRDIAGDVSLCAVVEGNRVYIAFHGQLPGSYPLICLDRQSGKVLWESKVWVLGARMSYEGLWQHCVSISVTGDRVLVYGASCDCAYIEGFNAEKGTALFRFGTPRAGGGNPN